MSINPECPVCPVGNDNNLRFLASRVEKVFVSAALNSLAHENMNSAEDELRSTEITPRDIERFQDEITEDIKLSATGCFTVLHERARADAETLAILTTEQSIAVAGCATHRLRRTCEL